MCATSLNQPPVINNNNHIHIYARPIMKPRAPARAKNETLLVAFQSISNFRLLWSTLLLPNLKGPRRQRRVHRAPTSSTPARVVPLPFHLYHGRDALFDEIIIHSVPYIVEHSCLRGDNVNHSEEFVPGVPAAAVIHPELRCCVAHHATLLQDATQRITQVILRVLGHAKQ